MSDEVTRTLASHGRRIAKLEGSVNELNTDLSKLHLTLEHIDDRASDRFATLNTSQVELKQILQTRDDEARAYRERREEFEREQRSSSSVDAESFYSKQPIYCRSYFSFNVFNACFGTARARGDRKRCHCLR